MNPEYIEKRIQYNFIQHNTVKNGLLYKYCSVETLGLILRSQSLFYSIPDQFIDPFELTTTIFKKFDDLHYVKNFMQIEEERLLKNYSSETFRFYNKFNANWENMKKQFGISCFSKSPFITLMWSHYADKYKGVCIGFDFDSFPDDKGLIQMPVRYLSNIEEVDFWDLFDRGFGEIAVYSWILSKSNVWEYEQEVRRFFSFKNGLIPFNIKSIKEIYFGIRCPKDSIIEVESQLKDLNLQDTRLINTIINPKTYSIGR